MPEGDNSGGGVPTVGPLTREDRDNMRNAIESMDTLRKAWYDVERTLRGSGCVDIVSPERHKGKHHHLIFTTTRVDEEACSGEVQPCPPQKGFKTGGFVCSKKGYMEREGECPGFTPGIIRIFEMVGGEYRAGLLMVDGAGLWVRKAIKSELAPLKDTSMEDLIEASQYLPEFIVGATQHARSLMEKRAKNAQKAIGFLVNVKPALAREV